MRQFVSSSVRHRYRLSVQGCNSFCRINLVAFSIRVLDPGPPQYGTSVLRWRSKTARVGWESVPRSRQTNRRARGRKKERERARESESSRICLGRDEMRERKKNSGAWAVPPAAFYFPKTSTGFQTSAKPFCIGEGLPSGGLPDLRSPRPVGRGRSKIWKAP